ncbi:mycofactocin biosynthesis glycosyltransferase MftF [Blastococcus mobilis]|uniref:Mycofactocin system glycosyltransferase n=1 Tax=Blastococcus mobilis TaxID=1938746 RepID=A0A238YHA0_9ACTN|nr:mycofactocin biosynthesis glycosyltransferase MftF [Blastococcus mobilis]SNR70342.1 mycofactocin system glycosyltransferase [Blastococcus mobilis]
MAQQSAHDLTGPVPDALTPAAAPAAPQRRLPDGFAVRLDPRTRSRDDGAALLGGSPLRLLRLSPRARQLLAPGRLVVRDATTAALAARLLDAGLGHPDLPAAAAPHDVTVVIPVKDRPAGLGRLLSALRADPATRHLPVIVVDDGSTVPVPTAHGVRVLRFDRSRGPAAARNAGLRAAPTPFVAFLDSDCVPRPGWLQRLRPHLDDPRLAVVAPRIVALPDAGRGWFTPYEAAVSALDMGAHPAAVRPGSAVSYVPSAALLARRAALGAPFDEDMPVAEDVDLIWRLTAAGWRVRYEPGAAVAHEHPGTTREWLRRRAFYGTGAALLAARHGGAVAPLVMAPETALAWGLALSGRRAGRVAAAGVLAVTVARLASRLAAPGERPPAGFAALLVTRGVGASGRALARSVTRHHWPLALSAALTSRRARRWVLGVATADAVLAWWPHRSRVGPVRFAVARRLEDLAYGAGLWRGASRARDPRALLPTRPPRLTPARPVGPQPDRWWKRR